MNRSPPPVDLATLFDAALTRHADNRREEAVTLYRQILEHDPNHAQSLGMLAMILTDGPDETEAEAMLLRHLALRPQDGASLHGLGRLKARQGDDEAAVALFRLAAQWLPGLAPIFNDLGVSLQRLGRGGEALAALDQAVELEPGSAVAHVNRGVVLVDCGRFGEAFDAQLAALANAGANAGEIRASALENLRRAAHPAGRLGDAAIVARAQIEAGGLDVNLVEQLALILDASHSTSEAIGLRNEFARGAGIQTSGRATGAEATILLLGAVGGGHVPIRYLIDPQRFTALSVSLLSPNQPDAPLGPVDIEALANVDVVFNTLGDIDHDGGQIAAASALCDRLGKPVLNPPGAIRRTGRDHAPELFAEIPGLVTPATRRASPEQLAGMAIEAPLLVRPAGDHGGENLILLNNDADKHAYLSTQPNDRLLLTAFHPFRSDDGLWRKYRLIFVDRRVYPYHLAIADDWLVHYWRTDMIRSDWKRAEEERFLCDWRYVFGPRAAAAVEEVARRLDLDYGGMDCALTADGRVILFEANACILLHLDEPAAKFAYKHRYVPPIRDAFSQLVLDRANRRTT